jgi:hypothetical protein
VSEKPSAHIMMVQTLGRTVVQRRLSATDVLYWLGDIF